MSTKVKKPVPKKAPKKKAPKKAPKKKAPKKALAHTIDITPPSAAWLKALPRAKAIVTRAALTALEGTRSACEVSIVLTTDAQVRTLNRQYRHQDKPTNVLSFPAGTDAFPVLGDVVVAVGVAQREARSENKTLSDHLTHLVIHGVLHLLGYDHIRDKDAVVMERRESALMAHLGLPDPYADVAKSVATSTRR